MANYAGETYEVVATADDFDGEPIGPTDVDSVSIEIFDFEDTSVVAETAMSWSVDDEEWVYTWDTEGLDAGTYKGKVVLHGPGDTISFEIKRLRLARSSV